MTTALKDHLDRIYAEAGKLTAAIVVDRARDEAHPLHSRFEWDDSVAAESHRRTQASDLIRSVDWIYAKEPDGTPKKVRAFHSVTRTDGPSYVPAEEIRGDEFLTRLTLQVAEREWKQMLRRYSHLAEFLDVVRRDLEAS